MPNIEIVFLCWTEIKIWAFRNYLSLNIDYKKPIEFLKSDVKASSDVVLRKNKRQKFLDENMTRKWVRIISYIYTDMAGCSMGKVAAAEQEEGRMEEARK